MEKKVKRVLMTKIPNLYLSTVVMSALALMLLFITNIHFMIIWCALGLLAFLPNFWIASYYGYEISSYLSVHYEKEYKKYEGYTRYKGVSMVSSEILKDVNLCAKLNSDMRYNLKKYFEAKRNIIFSFVICVLSVLFSTFFIINP